MAGLTDAINATLDGRPKAAPSKPRGAATQAPADVTLGTIDTFGGVKVLSTTWRQPRPDELLKPFTNAFPSREGGALECLSVTQTSGYGANAPFNARTYAVVGKVVGA